MGAPEASTGLWIRCVRNQSTMWNDAHYGTSHRQPGAGSFSKVVIFSAFHWSHFNWAKTSLYWVVASRDLKLDEAGVVALGITWELLEKYGGKSRAHFDIEIYHSGRSFPLHQGTCIKKGCISKICKWIAKRGIWRMTAWLCRRWSLCNGRGQEGWWQGHNVLDQHSKKSVDPIRSCANHYNTKLMKTKLMVDVLI